MLIIFCATCDKKFSIEEDSVRLDFYKIEIWQRSRKLSDRFCTEICDKCFIRLEEMMGLNKKTQGRIRKVAVRTTPDEE